MFTSIYVKSRIDLISQRKKMIITLLYDHEVYEILKNASNLEFSFNNRQLYELLRFSSPINILNHYQQNIRSIKHFWVFRN